MKTKFLLIAFFASIFNFSLLAQDRTTVTATSNDISDNLDLRAVASIFGESENLEDFERRLNDPKTQISNLDLNGDNQVDYLRVIESVEDNTHLIVIQSVLGGDQFQDIATVEVERDRNNNVQVQVVGDVYMYGDNFIYEPVYYTPPVIYNVFWTPHYHPYYSGWYWNYYPTYYYGWAPYPVFRYRNNINVYINPNHHYNYVHVRRSHRAIAMYRSVRADAYASQHPERSFRARNANVSNRHELELVRSQPTGTPRTSTSGIRSSYQPAGTRTTNSTGTPRAATTTGVRSSAAPKTVRSTTTTQLAAPVEATTSTPRSSVRTSAPRSASAAVTNTPRPVRQAITPRASAPRTPSRTETLAPRSAAPSRATQQQQPRMNPAPAPRSSGGSFEGRGGRRR